MVADVNCKRHRKLWINMKKKKTLRKKSKRSVIIPKKKKHVHKKHGCVVKRRAGTTEDYDERKVYGSVYAACTVVHLGEKECERISDAIAKKVTQHIKKRKEVGSHMIMNTVVAELKKHNKHAAFMYETHMDVA